MKHNWTVTAMLIMFFVLAQLTGLWLINKESKITVDAKTNSSIVSFNDTAIGARPETTGSGSLIYVLIAIAIGTGLVLLIAKFGKTNLWRIWFFLAVWMALTVSIGVVLLLLRTDFQVSFSLLFPGFPTLFPNDTGPVSSLGTNPLLAGVAYKAPSIRGIAFLSQ